MRNLITRIGTAFVAAPLLLLILFTGPSISWIALCAVAMFIAAYELARLDDQAQPFAQTVLVTTSFVVFLDLIRVTRPPYYNPGVTWMWWVPSAVVVVCLLCLLVDGRLIHSKGRFHFFALVVGPIYLGSLTAALALIRTFGDSRQGAGLCVFVMLVAWLSDAIAMLFGKTFGGPKLAPLISPNKTWSGAFGGIIGSLVAVPIVQLTCLPELAFKRGLLLALVAGIFGQLGDLAESALKRAAQKKDSGALLPGHGGVLDRIDALLFAAFVVFAALEFGVLPFARH